MAARPPGPPPRSRRYHSLRAPRQQTPLRTATLPPRNPSGGGSSATALAAPGGKPEAREGARGRRRREGAREAAPVRGRQRQQRAPGRRRQRPSCRPQRRGTGPAGKRASGSSPAPLRSAARPLPRPRGGGRQQGRAARTHRERASAGAAPAAPPPAGTRTRRSAAACKAGWTWRLPGPPLPRSSLPPGPDGSPATTRSRATRALPRRKRQRQQDGRQPPPPPPSPARRGGGATCVSAPPPRGAPAGRAARGRCRGRGPAHHGGAGKMAFVGTRGRSGLSPVASPLASALAAAGVAAWRGTRWKNSLTLRNGWGRGRASPPPWRWRPSSPPAPRQPSLHLRVHQWPCPRSGTPREARGPAPPEEVALATHPRSDRLLNPPVPYRSLLPFPCCCLIKQR